MPGIRSLAGAAALALLAGCATGPTPPGALIADPHEGVNRDLHAFNTGLDRAVLRPLAYVYKEATPALTQHLVSNAIDHLRLPAFFANRLLQGDLEGAGVAVGRFVANTILGAGGLLDPATELGLAFEPTDFGMTLAKAGVGEGAYVVAPFLGPNTTRHLVGRIVGLALDPVSYLSLPPAALAARAALTSIDLRAENFDAVDDVLYDSPAPYTASRSIYIQNRRALIAGAENAAADAAPDIYATE